MFYTPLIHKAIDFAIKVHETDSKKKRKGKDIPYIVHPLTVALILSRVTDDEEIIIAGILHDTIEDCEPYGSVTVNTISEMFSPRVAELVNSVTEQDKNLPWKERKLQALNEIPKMTDDQLLVKTADVLNNLTELLEDINRNGLQAFSNFNASQEMTIDRYKNLELRLTSRWQNNPLLPELSNAVNQLFASVENKSLK